MQHAAAAAGGPGVLQVVYNVQLVACGIQAAAAAGSAHCMLQPPGSSAASALTEVCTTMVFCADTAAGGPVALPAV